MSSLLIVGSVALDTIQTPAGASEDLLGGSASYASLAAALLEKTHIVGIVGEDFPVRYRRLLERSGVKTTHLTTVPGETFRWTGSYEGEMAEAHTRATHLNVFESFRPVLKDDMAGIQNAFLGNIDPDLQLSVLSQLKNPAFTACDTMNFWITGKKDKVQEVFSKVHVVLINAHEARLLTGETSLTRVGQSILSLGPRFVVIKRGEHGATLFWKGGQLLIPAYPITRLVDPTGAGDTFAGGLCGWIARQERVNNRAMVEGCLIGSALASFTCEGLGVTSLMKANVGRLLERCEELRRLSTLPPVTLRNNAPVIT